MIMGSWYWNLLSFLFEGVQPAIDKGWGKINGIEKTEWSIFKIFQSMCYTKRAK